MTASKAAMAEVADRRTKLVQLRREGVPFEDQRILDLGYSSRNHATKDLVRALETRRDDMAAEVSVYRQEENERLDALLTAVWPIATTPSPRYDSEGIELERVLDLKAVDTVLKLMDRRAKLNGYDVPTRTELSGPDGGAVPFTAATLTELNDLIATAGNVGLEAADIEDAGADD